MMSRVTLIHKGGGKDKENIVNYRPIAVINIIAKIFGILTNEKLRAWTETQIRLEQNGFRKCRGGLVNIYVLREIIKRSKHQGRFHSINQHRKSM